MIPGTDKQSLFGKILEENRPRSRIRVLKGELLWAAIPGYSGLLISFTWMTKSVLEALAFAGSALLLLAAVWWLGIRRRVREIEQVLVEIDQELAHISSSCYTGAGGGVSRRSRPEAAT